MSPLITPTEFIRADDSYPKFTHDIIKKVLPDAKRMLDADYIKVLTSIPRSYMENDSLKDRVVSVRGLSDLPFLYGQAKSNATWCCGDGLVLYEARDDKTLRYVSCTVAMANTYNLIVYFLPVGKIFKILRHINRQERKRTKDNKPPILESGLLDTIINQSIGFLFHSNELKKYKVKVRRGILLHGEPGNGKTMICQWINKICNDRNIGTDTVTGGEIEEAYHKSKLSQLVNRAPVIFFDDIDMSFLSRGHGHRADIACSMLAALDGVQSHDHVVRIFTTNEEVKTIDPAFTRPGRIDRSFLLRKPVYSLRKQLAETWPTEIIDTVLPEDVAKNTLDRSFAEMECLKSILVSNQLFKKTGWDLNLALEDFKKYGVNTSSPSMGFRGDCDDENEEIPVLSPARYQVPN